jgi:sulfur-oxidizing protein SoxY
MSRTPEDDSDRLPRPPRLGGASRRGLLRGFAASVAGFAAAGVAGRAAATPESLEREVWRLIGPGKPKSGRIKVSLPTLAENGNVVPIRVAVDSPMTPDDYCSAIHVFAEENPWPTIVSIKLTPASGRADIRTRMRLGKSQDVYVYAVMSGGDFYMYKQHVDVTVGGCG